jgi:hypothetical protein
VHGASEGAEMLKGKVPSSISLPLITMIAFLVRWLPDGLNVTEE